MCGRFNFTDEQLDEIKQIIKEANERIYGSGRKVKTGEVYPTNLAAVLVWEDSRVTPLPVKWGFPKWPRQTHEHIYSITELVDV